MPERRKAGAVAGLKLRACQEVVDTCFELSGCRTSRCATGKGTAARVILEIGREVSLEADVSGEVPDDRDFKTFRAGVPPEILLAPNLISEGLSPRIEKPVNISTLGYSSLLAFWARANVPE